MMGCGWAHEAAAAGQARHHSTPAVTDSDSTAAAPSAQVLGTTNVLSAPVLDEDGEYYGCLSVNDLLKSLYTRELGVLGVVGHDRCQSGLPQTSKALLMA